MRSCFSATQLLSTPLWSSLLSFALLSCALLCSCSARENKKTPDGRKHTHTHTGGGAAGGGRWHPPQRASGWCVDPGEILRNHHLVGRDLHLPVRLLLPVRRPAGKGAYVQTYTCVCAFFSFSVSPLSVSVVTLFFKIGIASSTDCRRSCFVLSSPPPYVLLTSPCC